MEELVIKTHSFEQSKNQLKKFSEENTADLNLRHVDSDKGLGEFLGDIFCGRGWGLDHKVTGAELNTLTTQIQSHLIDVNNMQRSFIKEIGHVYTALEALDKDYITAIVIAVKSAQKANGEAKIAQADIEKTIEEQKKIIKVLQEFKEKLDEYEHIYDIDEIWQKVDSNSKSIQDCFESIEIISGTLDKQLDRMNKVDEISHLADVDVMFDSYEKLIEKVKFLEENKKGLEEQNQILSSKLEEIECKLSNKIKTVYLLSGGAIGLFVVGFISAMLGLI